MRYQLAAAAILLAGCGADATDASGNPAITTDDVKAISGGQWNGGTNFSGTWELHTKVTATNCIPFEGFLLPTKGEEDDETVVLVHNDGELTQGLDEVGSVREFHGGISGSGLEGQFEYGLFYDLAGGLTFIEIVNGTMTQPSANEVRATITGTAKRRYYAALIDCSADLEVTGVRTLVGGGGDGGGMGGGGGAGE
jgi:hypothetical protein